MYFFFKYAFDKKQCRGASIVVILIKQWIFSSNFLKFLPYSKLTKFMTSCFCLLLVSTLIILIIKAAIDASSYFVILLEENMQTKKKKRKKRGEEEKF